MRQLALIVMGCALVLGCSSNTEPTSTPTFAGTWHVSVGMVTPSGSISPTTFAVTVTQIGTTYSGTMPDTIWWSGVHFDSTATVRVSGDTLIGGILASSSYVGLCYAVGFEAVANAARDSAVGTLVVEPDPSNTQPQTCMAEAPVMTVK